MKQLLALLAVLLLSAPTAARAADAPPPGPIVRASLLARQTGIVPGQPFTLGVLLVPQVGWHTYWENPGDAGIPTSLAWTLPPGFTAGPIDWPSPQGLPEGPLVTFSYTGPTLLTTQVTPPASFSAQSYSFSVKASWLVCKDICIPESATLNLTLPVAANAAQVAPSASAALFELHRRNRPLPLKAGYHADAAHITLLVPLAGLNATGIRTAQFFPRPLNLIRYADAQKLIIGKDTLQLVMDKSDGPVPQAFSGILMLVTEGGTKHYDVALAPVAAPPAAKAPARPVPPFLPVVLLLAVLGGLVLNLMPCVLPVLSLKALAIARKSGHEHATVIRMGLAYTLGILASFAVIAGILISLRQGGEAIGWGYQMQSPVFVGFLIYLLFVVGLNLSGLFHLPVLLGGVGGELADESSVRGSFFTGVLATAVATPCTAPFMASAIGVALTLSPLPAMLVFEALGFGLALPFLLISLFPALLRFLPKPGAWMETFRQLLAFPMYASVIWLLWVLTLQAGAGGMVVALTGMLAIVGVLWMKALFKEGMTYRIAALALYALILALSLPMLGTMQPATAAMPGSHVMNGVTAVPFSRAKLEALRAEGKPVYVDATAAWCITCQVNARVALHTERTMAAFHERGVVLMIADWTRRNDDVTEFLSGFGYRGVPLNVFYPAHGGKPVVLPQLLTEDTIINTISGGEQ